MAKWNKSANMDDKSPKYKTGGRYFGKGIGKIPRGLALSPDMSETAVEVFKGEKQKRWRMYLNSYEGAMRTGDKRRLRGVRAMGIIVHAERVDPNWRSKLSLANKEIATVDDLARMAHDHFLAAQQNAAHVVFVKDNKIQSFLSFPKGYPQSTVNNPQSLEDNIIKNLGDTKADGADGYYIVENNPNTKLSSNEVSLHGKIAQKMDGYLGGIVLRPGFDYGLITVKDGALELQNKQLPLPNQESQHIQGYDGPFTVLDNHQDLIGHSVSNPSSKDIDDDSLTKIANKIERARDTTLLVYTEKGKTTGIQEVPNPLLKKAKKFDDFLTEQMQKYSADQVVAVLDSKKVGIAKPAARRTIKKLGIDMRIASRDIAHGATKAVDISSWGIDETYEEE